jgi:hypothetical protein
VVFAAYRIKVSAPELVTGNWGQLANHIQKPSREFHKLLLGLLKIPQGLSCHAV